MAKFDRLYVTGYEFEAFGARPTCINIDLTIIAGGAVAQAIRAAIFKSYQEGRSGEFTLDQLAEAIEKIRKPA